MTTSSWAGQTVESLAPFRGRDASDGQHFAPLQCAHGLVNTEGNAAACQCGSQCLHPFFL